METRSVRPCPVSRLENRLFIAMADPLNVLAIDDVRRITKLDIVPMIASERAITDKLHQIESAKTGTMEDIIQDAVRRDRALDSFEQVVEKSRAAVEAAKIEENKKIEAEMSKMLAEYRERIHANNDAVAKENERFAKWQSQKQQEERTIADAVAYFVS